MPSRSIKCLYIKLDTRYSSVEKLKIHIAAAVSSSSLPCSQMLIMCEATREAVETNRDSPRI